MNYQLIPKELKPIAEKVEAQQRISEVDALTLYGTNDLNALGMIANRVRERKNGNSATYIHNRYINYSNICILSCQFCAFAARKRDALLVPCGDAGECLAVGNRRGAYPNYGYSQNDKELFAKGDGEAVFHVFSFRGFAGDNKLRVSPGTSGY